MMIKTISTTTPQSVVTKTEPARNSISPLIIVTAIFVVANIAWSLFDNGMPDWDSAGHILNGLAYKDLLKHPHLTSGWIYKFLSVNYLYPPVTYIFSGAVKLIFGISPWVDGLVKVIYEALFCMCVYSISKKLLQNTLAAVMAVVVINFYPQNSFFSNQIMLDFPMLTMVALSLLALITWQSNPSLKHTILLGLAIGFACMTKQLAGAFLIVPAAVVFLQTVITKRFADSAKLIGAGIIPAIMALPWLIVTYPSLQKLAQYNTGAIGTLSTKMTYGWVLSTYLSGFPQMMTPVLLCGFFASLLVVGSKTHRALALVSVSAISGILLASSLQWAYPLDRYVMPALIATALYTGAAFSYAWSKQSTFFLKLAYSVLAGIGILQYLLVNYAPHPIPVPKSVIASLPIIGIGLRGFHGYSAQTNPEAADWGQKWILEQIRKEDKELPVYLQLMPNSHPLNVHTMELAGKLIKSNVVATTMRQWSVAGDTLEFTPEKALYYHWYLLKTGDQGNIFANKEARRSFADLTNFVRTSGKFRLMAMRSLPDRSICYLYRQK